MNLPLHVKGVSKTMNTISNYESSNSDQVGRGRAAISTEPVQPSTTPISDALLGNDPPIEKAHPGLQPALVFLAYPLALIAALCIAVMYFLFSTSNDQKGANAPAPTQSSSTSEAGSQLP